MEPARYLKAFRRRWAWIVACILVALAAGWITTATVTPPQTTPPPTHQYSADVLLLSDGSSPDPIVTNLDTLAVVATTSPVLEQVAAILDFKGNPTALTPTVVADHDTGILTISVVGDDREQAIKLADAYEQGLMAYLTDRKTASTQQRIDQLDAKIQELQTSGGHGAEVVTLETQRAHLAVKVRNAAAHLGLQQLAPPEATPLSSGTTTTEINVSRNGRLAIVGLIGLLAGLALALLLERFDTKVRTRDTAEERFGIPVIAEIPRIPRGHRRAIVPSTTPTSPAADAFRLLGAGIGVVTPHRDDARGRTVLVTSPGPADGKTTTVVNVAAALAEDGSRVLVVSADVRRPRLHEAFGAARAPGLAEAAKQDRARVERVRPDVGGAQRLGPRERRPHVASRRRRGLAPGSLAACAGARAGRLDPDPHVTALGRDRVGAAAARGGPCLVGRDGQQDLVDAGTTHCRHARSAAGIQRQGRAEHGERGRHAHGVPPLLPEDRAQEGARHQRRVRSRHDRPVRAGGWSG